MAIKYDCPRCHAHVYDPTVTSEVTQIKCIMCNKVIKLTKLNRLEDKKK